MTVRDALQLTALALAMTVTRVGRDAGTSFAPTFVSLIGGKAGIARSNFLPLSQVLLQQSDRQRFELSMLQYRYWLFSETLRARSASDVDKCPTWRHVDRRAALSYQSSLNFTL